MDNKQKVIELILTWIEWHYNIPKEKIRKGRVKSLQGLVDDIENLLDNRITETECKRLIQNKFGFKVGTFIDFVKEQNWIKRRRKHEG